MSARLRAGAAVALLALLGACTTTTTTTSTPGNASEPRIGRSSSDNADPERLARTRLDLAAAYLGRGQGQTALVEARAALAAKPDLPDAYRLLGLIHAQLGDLRQAEGSFQRALQLAPNDADTMHNYGWFLCQQQRFGDADVQFKAALAQPGYQGASRTTLVIGLCQARAGLWAEAERSLARAFELDPANPTIAYNLSEVLYRRGEHERARFYIKRVNAVPEFINAESLWLAARIERRLGNTGGVQDFARQLRDRFPQSRQAQQLELGRFDD
jgi:type IV pilus assembly protein PilF